jgi:hypothetical protein
MDMARLIHRCMTDEHFRHALEASEIKAEELAMDEQEVIVVAETMRRTEGIPLGDHKQHARAIFGTPWPDEARSRTFEQFLQGPPE